MISAPLPENEASRLRALQEYDILDTPAEHVYDELAILAAQICDTPIALVSLVDKHRQWFKARVGLEAPETSRDLAFCAHAILAPNEILEVPDSHRDERFVDNALVLQAPNVRFYAGSPLVNHNGLALGTLCVIDNKPRELTNPQRYALRTLGRQVMTQMELRASLREHERDRARLKNSERLYRGIVDHAGDMICLHRPDGAYEYVSPAGAAIIGYPVNELLGEYPHDYVHPEDVSHLREAFARVREGKVQFLDRFRFHRKGGGYIWIESHAVPVFGQEKHIIQIQTMNRDVTAEVEAEQLRQTLFAQLKEAQQKAEQANKAKSSFLASMSHEIRTPLNAVLGMSELLAETNLNAEQRDLVATVNNAGTNLLHLINGTLDLSKIESGELKIVEAPFVIRETADSALKIARASARTKELDYKLSIAEDVPERVLGDSLRLAQILINLLRNAVKFTESGSVELKMSVEDTAKGIHHLRFAVRDTGIGIPPDKLQIVLEPFTQVDTELTREFEGTGLGLAISRQLCRIMGGELAVQSELNVGSEFYFTLPLREVNTKKTDSAATLSEPAARPADRPVRLLLVDDNPDNQKLIKLFLRGDDYVIETAEDGAEAVQKFKASLQVGAKPFDLILMDMLMPVMDGMAATREIRAMEARENIGPIAIVALTANALKEDIDDAMGAGCSQYVTKPISKRVLFDTLEAALNSFGGSLKA